MQHALRPYASAGVAVVGAGLIALTPVGPASLDIQARAVRLSSVGSALDVGVSLDDQAFPIVTPDQLISDTTTNLEALEAQIAADPTPILTQVLANQEVYAGELSTAAQNAENDFTAALQGLPDVLQQASANLSSGDLYDALYGPYSYLLSSELTINHDLLTGGSEVLQSITTNIDNVINDTGAVVSPYAADFVNATGNGVPIWLSELIQAGLYPANAAMAAIDGVSDDISTALNGGDYTTALSDLANAPSTVLDAFLNGYDVDGAASPFVADALLRLGVPPEYGLLDWRPCCRQGPG